MEILGFWHDYNLAVSAHDSLSTRRSSVSSISPTTSTSILPASNVELALTRRGVHTFRQACTRRATACVVHVGPLSYPQTCLGQTKLRRSGNSCIPSVAWPSPYSNASFGALGPSSERVVTDAGRAAHCFSLFALVHCRRGLVLEMHRCRPRWHRSRSRVLCRCYCRASR